MNRAIADRVIDNGKPFIPNSLHATPRGWFEADPRAVLVMTTEIGPLKRHAYVYLTIPTR